MVAPAMGRRELLSLFAWPMVGGAAQKDTRHLVATPEGRAEYLRGMLRALCTEIGPRPSGSKGYDAGVAIIRRELERCLPAVSLDTLEFRRWVAVGEPLFQVGDRRLETYVADNSPDTPENGIRGLLRKNGQYEVVDQESGAVLARAGISEFGRAIVSSHSGKDGVPLFNLGRQDVETLDRAARENLPVQARARVKWIPGARTSSVAGTLPGDSKDEIMVVAHADTKYNTPGANDNTASLVTMLMLAHAVSGARPRKTLSFLATAGEELSYLGARHYAQTRKNRGTLGDIRICVNLDSLTYGPNLQINTTDGKLAQTILDIHRDLGIHTEPKVFQRDDTMDSAPFLAAGARTVHLNSRGDDARTLPLWHRPEDRAETVKPEFVESSFLVLRELIGRLLRV
ncbi:MAG: M28 family peptidase [Bryobacterales bacterium]|nr:M28 family peptidase [Bryobacterales bacterium]